MRVMSRRTKARVAREYNEWSAAALDVCAIVDDDSPDLRGRSVVLVMVVVVAVGIEGGQVIILGPRGSGKRR